jgi:hypothetical protein
VTIEINKEAGPAAVFAFQVIIGAFLYSVVLIAAFGLSKLVSLLQTWGAPEWMVWGAHLMEQLVFGLDHFLFGLFLLSEALKFVVGIWREWRP